MTFDGPTTPDPVERDDRLLDAISRGEPLGDHPADDPLAALLTGWHANVLARSQDLESTLGLAPVGPADQDPPAPLPTAPAAPGHGAARPARSERTPGLAALTQKPRWRPRHKA
ncbi:anti-sigma-D factor RsdA [Micromonospora sp. CA-259024]|uniref:anti-sigma-D factor RsdA n=1 Tax=Micromonospora sp. CA-259024 TaxID=3239965 RepID=UPI003D94C43F